MTNEAPRYSIAVKVAGEKRPDIISTTADTFPDLAARLIDILNGRTIIPPDQNEDLYGVPLNVPLDVLRTGFAPTGPVYTSEFAHNVAELISRAEVPEATKDSLIIFVHSLVTKE